MTLGLERDDVVLVICSGQGPSGSHVACATNTNDRVQVEWRLDGAFSWMGYLGRVTARGPARQIAALREARDVLDRAKTAPARDRPELERRAAEILRRLRGC